MINEPNVPKADVVDVELDKYKAKHAPPALYSHRLKIPKKLNNHAENYELFKFSSEHSLVGSHKTKPFIC